MPIMRYLLFAFLITLLHPAPLAAQSAPATPTGQFLHLSDIHFDPFADPTLFAQLNAAPVDQWEAIFKSSAVQTPVTGSNQDSNYPLLASTLAAAQKAGKYDYVIHTGDYLAHGFVGRLQGLTSDPAQAKAFTAKTVSFVNRMIGQAFPDAPLYATLGNNDSACDDYQLTPGGDILAPVGADLPVVAKDPAATRDFDAGGYYLTPHPTVADLDFIVLSIFWSGKYQDGCDPGAPDPAAAQLKWLQTTLAQQQKAGRRAILLMHIPPGIDGFSTYRRKGSSVSTLWTSDGKMLSEFLGLTAQYKAQLAGGFAGHTHMDEFRILADKVPYMAIRMAPSVTPYNGNRSAFTVFDYNPKDGSTLDYSVLTYANGQWSPEYRFSQAYKLSGYSAASLGSLAKRIMTDSTTRGIFGQYYASGNPTPASRPDSWQYFGCALSALTVKSYQACLGGVRNVGRAKRRN